MKLVWLGLGVWEEVTRRVEGEEVGRSQIMWGHFRDLVFMPEDGKPLKDCKEVYQGQSAF